jgi:hypothetical protein
MSISCICHNIPLEEAIQKAPSLGDLQAAGICATKCKLCVPFLEDLFRQKSKGRQTHKQEELNHA